MRHAFIFSLVFLSPVISTAHQAIPHNRLSANARDLARATQHSEELTDFLEDYGEEIDTRAGSLLELPLVGWRFSLDEDNNDIAKLSLPPIGCWWGDTACGGPLYKKGVRLALLRSGVRPRGRPGVVAGNRFQRSHSHVQWWWRAAVSDWSLPVSAALDSAGQPPVASAQNLAVVEIAQWSVR